MAVELAPPSAAAELPPGGPIVRGADLVHLAEAINVRLLRLTGGLVLAGGVMALVLGVASDGVPTVATVTGALAGLLFALFALRRPGATYVWLRRGFWPRVTVVALAALMVLGDGVDGPSWWVALALLLMIAIVSSTLFSMLSAVVVTAGYLAGALIAGGTLARHGADAGVLAGASGLLANTLIARVISEGFMRLVLSLRQAQVAASEERAPRPVPNLAAVPADPAPPASPPARVATGRLSARQLEVALLARDGLRSAEIAAALAISVTQVERHLKNARERVGASNTNELLATIVRDGLVA